MVKRQKARILIVEDDEAMAPHLRRSIEQLGYEVSAVVATGEEAIAQVKESVPDLILMDVTLSGKIDGIGTVEQIHSFQEVPVVYVTGRVDIEQWQRAKITEPFGYLLKPFELRELDVVIAAALYKFRKEQELFTVNNRWHHYLENFGGVVLRSDLDFKPVMIQGAVEKVMGYKADEIMAGKPQIEDIFHPEERPLCSVEDREKLKVLPSYAVVKECRIVTRDKQIRWVRKIIRNVAGQSGEPAAMEWIIYDITDFKNMQDALKELRRQLLQLEKLASIGQLTAGVAHEINNPVGFISNNVEMLRQYVVSYIDILKIVENLKKSIEQNNMESAKSIVAEMSKFEEEINLDYMINDADKLLEHTQRGIDRIQKVVMGLRTFARRDNEIMEMADVEAVLESIINIVWNEIKYKAELKKEYGKIPPVKCNSQELGQVFINLLANAAQSITDKGEITVKTYVNANHACIAIRDTGCGIAPEDIKKIFTPFYTTKQAGQGTGLGLSVSYDIIKQHGGDILINSQPGRGTTFTVLLPLQI